MRANVKRLVIMSLPRVFLPLSRAISHSSIDADYCCLKRASKLPRRGEGLLRSELSPVNH